MLRLPADSPGTVGSGARVAAYQKVAIVLHSLGCSAGKKIALRGTGKGLPQTRSAPQAPQQRTSSAQDSFPAPFRTERLRFPFRRRTTRVCRFHRHSNPHGRAGRYYRVRSQRCRERGTSRRLKHNGE